MTFQINVDWTMHLLVQNHTIFGQNYLMIGLHLSGFSIYFILTYVGNLKTKSYSKHVFCSIGIFLPPDYCCTNYKHMEADIFGYIDTSSLTLERHRGHFVFGWSIKLCAYWRVHISYPIFCKLLCWCHIATLVN